jgi:hypoxia up-regulated 1
MKVALVQRNSPLEIVTNLHSKRKTEQMVLFDAGTRFYGADADSLLARKPHLTPQSMSIFLGRSADHPTVQVSLNVNSNIIFFINLKLLLTEKLH